MDDFIQAIEQYDLKEDYQGLGQYVISTGKKAQDLVFPVHVLIHNRRYSAAYTLALLTQNSGFNNVVLAFALAIGGSMFNNQSALQHALAFLRVAVRSATPEQHRLIKEITEPAFDRLAQMAIQFNSPIFTLNLLEILKAVFPYMDQQFTWLDDVPELDVEAIRARGHAHSKLIRNPLPPADAPKVRRRVVVAVRSLSNPNDPTSRPQDIGPRIVKAMQEYGWDAHFYGIACQNLQQDYQDITNLCRQINAELLVLDDHIIVSSFGRPARVEMINTLHQELPGFRVVSAQFDTWAIPTEIFLEASAVVDAFWESTSPSLPAWSDPVFANKPILRTQLPHGGRYGQKNIPLKQHITFLGAVQGFNWHRVFWLAAATKYNLPIEVKLVSHSDDGLSAMESYAGYMERIAEATCALNLSTRPNHMQIVTGRCFESMISGSLLIQEETPDLDYYFIAGEHYLPFSNITELRSICKFIQTRPAEAEEIRRRGTEFARDCYSDEKIIGSLDKMLYY